MSLNKDNKTIEKIKEVLKKVITSDVFKMILLAFAVNLFCDILNQRSILTALARIFTKPLNGLFNTLIVLITISISGLFKHRKFALVLCCLPWVGLSIANFIVQCFRKTPLSFVDFKLVLSVLSVFNSYLSVFEIILIVLAVVGLITGLVFLYKKEKLQERIIKKSVISFVLTFFIVLVIRTPFIKVGALSDDYSNLIDAYTEYGLPYCFVVSVVDRNVDKPDVYDKETVDKSLEKLEELMAKLEKNPSSKYTVTSNDKPNIIFLQLESFMDVNNILNLDFSENPVSYFSYLKENYPSGSLLVPTYGAGTANVEFEIMTGLNLDYFGAGEYPYTTVMSDQTTETIAYNLQKYGYYSTIIHNNRAAFYNRDEVFKNMGYDRFVSLEFMSDVEYTQVGWAKDICLSDQILKALNSTEETDFIYTISVQPHGNYLDSFEAIENTNISCSFNDGTVNDELLAKYTYYINQLKEVDEFLENLIERINDYDEPVMLVMYGDHLPNLDLENDNLSLGDTYLSEYVIYTNYEISLEDKDLSTYTLGSYILNNIGCYDGIINKLHQTKDLNEEYGTMYQLFEYDMFTDNMYLWSGTNPYPKMEMQLGYDDTSISSVIYADGNIIVKGENFTESSYVFFGTTRQKTVLIDNNTLLVKVKKPAKELDISVKQLSLTNKNVVYATSNVIKYALEEVYFE